MSLERAAALSAAVTEQEMGHPPQEKNCRAENEKEDICLVEAAVQKEKRPRWINIMDNGNVGTTTKGVLSQITVLNG